MSSKSNNLDSPSPRVAPHIRLNSGQQNLVSYDDNPQASSAASRSLTSTGRLPQIQTSQIPSSSASRLQESQERLLPPTSSQPRRLRDQDSPVTPAERSAFSSRRTSWSSEWSRDSRDYQNPFSDSRVLSRSESRADSDDEDVNTQTVAAKYNILPSAGLLLFPEDVEKDDYLHNPDPSGKEDRDCDIFTKRGMLNVGGLALIVVGLLLLFIGYPLLTFAGQYIIKPNPCRNQPDCIDVGPVPLLENVRQGLIDPDTPKSAMTKKDHSGKTMKLVFSDEFSSPGRTFYEGDDPFWHAMDYWYGVTKDLEWYDPDAVTTNDGVLELRFDAFQNHNLNYRSGMLQSWNQLCFKGGRLEASISLPGRGDVIGFWPGFWSMGNLGRAGYPATTEGMWPYSYHDECDAGITANQSSPDGLSSLPGMRLPACTCEGADHPSPGKSRSAPELDVLEASVHALDKLGNQVGHVSQTFQVAPFDIWHQANTDFMEIYDFSITAPNEYHGGPLQQSVSALVNLNNDWYDGKAYQMYAFEYKPGGDGESTFFVGDEATWRITGPALAQNGNVGQRVFPEEPMYVIANFGMSEGFSNLNLTGIADLLPATMRIDYIRIYQDPDDESVTCDPPGYETTRYIVQHYDAYTNPNYTLWSDTSYDWPKNSLIDSC